jgi:hypothetical protein
MGPCEHVKENLRSIKHGNLFTSRASTMFSTRTVFRGHGDRLRNASYTLQQ